MANSIWRKPAQSRCVTRALFVDSGRPANINPASTAVDITLSACQPWTITICQNTTSLLYTLHHHKRVCWDVCVRDNVSGLGMGGWLTPSAWWHHSQVSMEWRSSSVLSLSSSWLLHWFHLHFPSWNLGALFHTRQCHVSPLTHPLCKHSHVRVVFYNAL